MEAETIKVSDFTIEPIIKKAATPFIEKWHYSHYAGGIQHRQCFGLYSPDGSFHRVSNTSKYEDLIFVCVFDGGRNH